MFNNSFCNSNQKLGHGQISDTCVRLNSAQNMEAFAVLPVPNLGSNTDRTI